MNSARVKATTAAMIRYCPCTATFHWGQTPVVVCSRGIAGSGDAANKLGNRKFLRLVLGTATAVVIQAAGASTGGATVPATDPDIFVHRRGSLVAVSNATGPTETIVPARAAGRHVHHRGL